MSIFSQYDLGRHHDILTPGGGGTSGDDTLNGTKNDDVLKGLGGDDLLNGADGDDTLIGGKGDNTMNGGKGDDRITLGSGADVIDGGVGKDILFLTADKAWTFGESVSLAIGDGQNNGHGGIFTVSGMEYVSGSKLGDNITGDGGANVLAGGEGNDNLDGADGNDLIYGDGVFNAKGKITAEVGHEVAGVRSFDLINGGLGDDTIVGGYGADSLTGGDGHDTFVFLNDSSKPGMSAFVTDLTDDDTVDLHLIDADLTKAGDQKFRLVDHFTGHAGEATLMVFEGESTGLLLDTDGDGHEDISITLGGGDHSSFHNFVL